MLRFYFLHGARRKLLSFNIFPCGYSVTHEYLLKRTFAQHLSDKQDEASHDRR